MARTSPAGREAPGPLRGCLGDISIKRLLLNSEASRTILLLLVSQTNLLLLLYKGQLLLGVSSWYPSLDVSGPAISFGCPRAGYLDVFSSCSERQVNKSQPEI